MQEERRDWSECEIVEFNPLKMGGAPTVRGRRITPDAFVENFNDGYTPREIATEIFDDEEQDVRAILKFAEQHGWLERPL